MAANNTLKDYQATILARLEEAKKVGSAESAGSLGVVIAGKQVLVNMREISETLPVMTLFPVPLVKSWFLGVANVRGVLYAVNDIGQLISGVPTPLSASARVLLMNNDIAAHVALMVEKLIGLRKLELMQRVEAPEAPDFCMKSEAYADEAGKIWYVLDCNQLVLAKEFIQVY